MTERLIIGRQPVLEALKAEQPIEKILIQHGTHGDIIDSIFAAAKRAEIPITQASKERFRELAPEQTTQGVIAILALKQYVEVTDILKQAEEKNEPPFLLVFDEIEDPHNLGALIRTAECTGVHGVIISKHHSASINATVMKTSAGAAA